MEPKDATLDAVNPEVPRCVEDAAAELASELGGRDVGPDGPEVPPAEDVRRAGPEEVWEKLMLEVRPVMDEFALTRELAAPLVGSGESKLVLSAGQDVEPVLSMDATEDDRGPPAALLCMHNPLSTSQKLSRLQSKSDWQRVAGAGPRQAKEHTSRKRSHAAVRGPGPLPAAATALANNVVMAPTL